MISPAQIALLNSISCSTTQTQNHHADLLSKPSKYAIPPTNLVTLMNLDTNLS
jgi:hypothetical protein